MKSSSPLISIVITNYNYGEYIAQAIESALAQTYENIEIIILNDGSTDNSEEVIAKYYKVNPKIRYYHQDNRGIVYTRNKGLKLAKGEFVCFLDADDFFNRNYIEKVYQMAEKFDADVVYPNWHFVGDGVNEPDTNFAEFDPKLLQLQIIHCTAESLIRKSAIGEHVFKSKDVAEDWEFFIGLSLDGTRFKLAKNIFINYRIKPNSRGSKNNALDDMRSFTNILERYKKEYGNKVVDPLELPITKYAEYKKQLELHYEDLEQGHKLLERDYRRLEKKTSDLESDINDISNSYSYRIGLRITAPWRFFKELAEKNKR